MIQERDVKAKMAALLRDEISIVDFVRWIMANSWNMHSDSSDRAVDLVSDIHLLIAERDDLSLSDEAFRHEVASLLNNVVVSSPIAIPAEQLQGIVGRFAANSSNLFAPVRLPLAA